MAHRIGAGDFDGARAVLRRSFLAVGVFSLLLALSGIGISGVLPEWLGGDNEIQHDSSIYFLIYASFLPVLQLNFLAGGMLRSSGNMRIPSMLGVLMCLLDVVFNYFLIFRYYFIININKNDFIKYFICFNKIIDGVKSYLNSKFNWKTIDSARYCREGNCF